MKVIVVRRPAHSSEGQSAAAAERSARHASSSNLVDPYGIPPRLRDRPKTVKRAGPALKRLAG
jgi:hypothetical protein